MRNHDRRPADARRPATTEERKPAPVAFGPAAILALQRSAGNASVTRLLAREPAYGPPLPDDWVPPGPAPEWATADLRRKLSATVLAESGIGQEDEVRWIYLTRVTRERGEAGLEGSSAYRKVGFRYRLFLFTLGDPTYGDTPLPPDKNYRGFANVADYATRNAWWQKNGLPRAERLQRMVDEMLSRPGENPHPGWIGQGSLKDFNNESNPDVYWTRARAYFWLQERGEVNDIWVKVLHGELTTVIFDADSIAAYFAEHPLPKTVPAYHPK
jgi:hypothetical protein